MRRVCYRVSVKHHQKLTEFVKEGILTDITLTTTCTMEIVKSDSQVLHIVSHRSIRIPYSLMFYGLFWTVIGIFGLISAKLTTLECDRQSNPRRIECVRSMVNSMGWKTTEKIPGDLQAAKIDRVKSMTSVQLLTTAGLTTGIHSSPNEQLIIANTIKLNDFIKNERETQIKIEQDDGQQPLLISSFVIAFGLFWLYPILRASQKVTCRFDKSLDRVFIDTKYLSHIKIQEISQLSKIKKVSLKESLGTLRFYRQPADKVFEILLIIDYNKSYSISTLITKPEPYSKIIKEIEQFLGISKL